MMKPQSKRFPQTLKKSVETLFFRKRKRLPCVKGAVSEAD